MALLQKTTINWPVTHIKLSRCAGHTHAILGPILWKKTYVLINIKAPCTAGWKFFHCCFSLFVGNLSVGNFLFEIEKSLFRNREICNYEIWFLMHCVFLYPVFLFDFFISLTLWLILMSAVGFQLVDFV